MTQTDPPISEPTTLTVRALPASNQFNAGIEPIGAIDSPTRLDEYRVVLRDGTQAMHLQQALVTIEAETTTPEGELRRHVVLGQVRDLELRNHHHEQPLFKAYLRQHLEVPGLSGRADHRIAQVYPVDAVVLDEYGELIEKTSALSVLPGTGTHVHMANDVMIRKFIQGGRGLLAVGHLNGQTLLPLALPHNDAGDDGAGEARHYGLFGPSGTGKTSLLGEMMTGWARHPNMGQFVLDHDGDLSRMEIGQSDNGRPHFSLARAFTAVGRNPADVVRAARGDLRIEAAKDLATALRLEHFLEQLGVGAGEKRQACERAIADTLDDMLTASSFAQLSYEDAIASICDACASAYASSGRVKKRDEFVGLATGGGLPERNLALIWQRVQAYASAPVSMRELVEAALFDGKIVIVNLAGADSSFDELVTKRLVQTMLDVAHLAYVLKQEGNPAEQWHGRYRRYKPHFGRYRASRVNAIAVIDEAHMVASEHEVGDEGSVAHQLSVAIRRTRKFGLGFCFATQEISTVAKSIFRGLGTRIFAYGLKSASEAERVKEVLADDSAFRLYRGFPDPEVLRPLHVHGHRRRRPLRQRRPRRPDSLPHAGGVLQRQPQAHRPRRDRRPRAAGTPTGDRSSRGGNRPSGELSNAARPSAGALLAYSASPGDRVFLRGRR